MKDKFLFPYINDCTDGEMCHGGTIYASVCLPFSVAYT